MRWWLACLIALSFCRVAKAEEYYHENASNLLLSGDGSTILTEDSYSRDDPERLRGWNLTSGKSLKLGAINREKFARAVTLSREGDALFVRRRDQDGNLLNYQIWSRVDNQFALSATLQPPGNDGFLDAVFHQRTLILVSGTAIETLDLTGKSLRRVLFPIKMSRFANPALSYDGQWLVAVVNGRRAIFDASTGQLHHLLEQGDEKNLPTGGYYSAHRFSPDGHFVMGSYNYIAEWPEFGGPVDVLLADFIWSAGDGKMIVWPYPSGTFFGDNQLLSGSNLDVWDIGTHKQVERLAWPWGVQDKRDIRETAISDDGKIWAVLDTKGNIGIGRKEIKNPVQPR